MLQNLWTKIVVEPLSNDELRQVVTSLYPQLSTIVERLLEIFLLLSCGSHATRQTSLDDQLVTASTAGVDLADVGKFVSHEGRLISTR